MDLKRCTGVIAAIVLLVVAFYLLHRADRSMRTSFVALNAPASGVPVGTWRAETGPVFQLRPDGTGRSYDPLSPQFGVNYFEWACDGSTFTICFAPRGRIMSLIAHWAGVETDQFAVDELTDDLLVLSDSTAQTQFTFTFTTDAVLDASP